MKEFIIYFFLFFLYAVLGWIVEITYVYLLDKKLINRGFLIGPYIPIYGSSAIIMILYLNQYKENPLTVFLLGVVICSILEYITSYLLEKIFNARWWDYSNLKFNVNGRICLKNSCLFGILGLILIYLINPLFIKLLPEMNTTWLYVIATFCFIIFVIDCILSFVIVFKTKDRLKEFNLDATIEIRKLVDAKIKRRYLHNRVFNAFPMLKFFRRK